MVKLLSNSEEENNILSDSLSRKSVIMQHFSKGNCEGLVFS